MKLGDKVRILTGPQYENEGKLVYRSEDGMFDEDKYLVLLLTGNREGLERWFLPDQLEVIV